MYRIALIQNTSEMRNYPFADLRASLTEMGFDVEHFTSENIHSLAGKLSHGIDCVVFASNSLHDDALKTYVYGEEFCRAFEKYLETGAALVMHQYKLAVKAEDTESAPALPFLGKKIRLVKDCRTEAERKSDKCCFKGAADANAYLTFPNRVSPRAVFERAVKCPGISGDFYMVLEGAEGEWVPIMTDVDGRGVIQRAVDKKIVFSSVMLDYQRHPELLENILINMLACNMSLAVFKERTEDSLGFNYFLNHLDNQKLYFKHYYSDESEYMLENIKHGVHSGVLVGSGMMEKLTDEELHAIDMAGVKLIKLRDRKNDGDDFFEVHSVDKTSCLNFAKAEREVQEELAKSSKESSFMVRVDLLSALSEFKDSGLCRGEYTAETLCLMLEDAKHRIDQTENGSYDDTFGATCRVLWLFYTFLGAEDKYTKKVCKYISGSDVSGYDVREQLDKYNTLSLFETDRAAYLREHCSSVINSTEISSLNEYDMLMLLDIACVTDDVALTEKLVTYAEDHVDSHSVNFGIYAAAVTASRFTDIYQRLSSREDAVSCDLCRRAEGVLFNLIKYLNSGNYICSRVDERMRVACALCKFESVTSFPVADLAELLFKTGTFPKEKREQEYFVDYIQAARLKSDKLFMEKEKLDNDCAAIKKEMSGIKKELRLKRLIEAALFAVLLLCAISVSVIVDLATMLAENGESVVDMLVNKVISWWPAFIAAIIAWLAKHIFERYIYKKKAK